jgi:hypothetical protein
MLLSVLPSLSSLPVRSAGETTENVANLLVQHNHDNVSDCSWSAIRQGLGTFSTGGAFIGWEVDTDAGIFRQLFRVKVTANFSKYENISEILFAAYLEPGQTYDPNPYFACWSNQDNQPYQQISSSCNWTSSQITGYKTLKFNSAGLEYVTTNETVVIWFTSSYDGLNIEPQGYDGEGGIDCFCLATTALVVITVTTGETPPTRDPTFHENAPTGSGSDDNITGLTWETPRCAYNDELIGVKVSGSVNTTCDLALEYLGGAVLSQVSDVIRSDGAYYGQASVSGQTSGYIRWHERHKDKYSTWGYLEQPPTDIAVDNTAVLYEDTGVYTRPVGDFVVMSTQVIPFYWNTSIQADEYGDYTIALVSRGTLAYTLFVSHLDDLAVDYYECGRAENEFLVSQRYMLIAMNTVSDNRQGLIKSINRPLVAANYGMVWTRLYYTDTPNDILTNADSAVYYVNTQAPIVINTGDSSVPVGGNVVISLANYAQLGGEYYFTTANGTIYYTISSPTGQVMDKELTTSTLYQDTVTLPAMIMPASLSTPMLRVTLNGNADYDYIHESGVSVTGGGGGDGTGLGTGIGAIPSWFTQFLNAIHANSPMGKWLVILVMVILECALLYKHKIALTVVVALTIGFALFAGWVVAWIWILVALMVAWVVFSVITKNRQRE